MEIEGIFLIAAITILSLILLVVTLLSYRKYQNKKLLVVSFIFLFLFVRGLLLSYGLFYDSLETLTSNVYIWSFDLIVLLLLYAAYSIKR